MVKRGVVLSPSAPAWTPEPPGPVHRTAVVVDLTDMDRQVDAELARWDRELAGRGLERVGNLTLWAEDSPMRASVALVGPWQREVTLESRVRRVPSPYDVEPWRPIAELNTPPVCAMVCGYAMDVGMAMHAPDPARHGPCGMDACGRYEGSDPQVWEGDQG